MQPLTLLIYYKGVNTYALNTLIGAVQHGIKDPRLHIALAFRRDELYLKALSAYNQGYRVVVGWSFYSTHSASVQEDLHWFREQPHTSDITHLAGGVHASSEPHATLRMGFDWVAMGEGEIIIVELLRRLLNGDDVYTTPGLAYIHGETWKRNPPPPLIQLDDFPPFADRWVRVNPIEITRGCIYACSFCQTPFMMKARFRHRSVASVMRYVQIMKENGAWDIRFITPTSLSYGSDDASVKPEAIEALLNGVRQVLGDRGRIYFGTFPSEVRPEHVTPDILRVLKKYVHNDNLLMGAQSGSQNILDRMHRGHDVACIEQAVRYSVEAGFLPNVDFIFGFPDETEEDITASLQLAERLTDMGARIHGHTFMPLPGTPLRSSPPGHLSERIIEKLHKFVSAGKMYGQWIAQRNMASELSKKSSRKETVRATCSS